MSIPTDDNPNLLTVVATMRAQPGKEGELRATLEALIEPTRAEAPNHVYALHQGTADPLEFAFYEVWDDQAGLDTHLASSHIQAALPKIPDLLDGELVIRPMRRLG